MGVKISERLKALRLEKGWSQEEAARRCGLSGKTVVSAIETQYMNFGIDKLEGICRAYGVSADYIIGRAGRTGWIPMDYELPDKEDLYLVAWLPTDRKCVYEHYYGLLQWDGDNWYNATDRHGKPMQIIAWRRLPDFYKEEDE